MGIVANKGSGTGRSRKAVDELAAALGDVGFQVCPAWTLVERESLVARANADPSCRCLVAVGGDGTFSALLNEQPRVPLAIFPAGTENLAAKHFHQNSDACELAARLATQEPTTIDLGLARARRFVLMAGFGFDGEVVTRHHRSRVTETGRVKPTGRFAYVHPILRSSFTYPFSNISVRVLDPPLEKPLEGTTVFVFNLPLYALGLPFVPDARADDGWLDLLVFRDPGPFQALYYLWNVLLRRHLKLPGVTHLRVKKIVVSSDNPVPVQLDGDPAGTLEPCSSGEGAATEGWNVEVLPASARVYAGRAAGASTPSLVRLASMAWNR